MPIISPKIPSGLEELMRGLAKSCIKENPENIYLFAAEYFENLLKERDGAVDQNYKKFATYKVYKKNKSARLKRGKENSSDVNVLPSNNGFKKDENSVSYGRKDSVEEIVLPESSKPLQNLAKIRSSISSESEINAEIKKEASIEADAAPPGDDDDVENMVLDDEMAHAALKIQASFRGHKVRREMRDAKLECDDQNLTDEQSADEIPSGDDVLSGGELQLENEIVPSDEEIKEAAENEIIKNDCEDEIDTVEMVETEAPAVDDEIANMVLDDEMAEAALKIQASFRGSRVRREIKKPSVDNAIGDVEDEEQTGELQKEGEGELEQTCDEDKVSIVDEEGKVDAENIDEIASEKVESENDVDNALEALEAEVTDELKVVDATQETEKAVEVDDDVTQSEEPLETDKFVDETENIDDASIKDDEAQVDTENVDEEANGKVTNDEAITGDEDTNKSEALAADVAKSTEVVDDSLIDQLLSVEAEDNTVVESENTDETFETSEQKEEDVEVETQQEIIEGEKQVSDETKFERPPTIENELCSIEKTDELSPGDIETQEETIENSLDNDVKFEGAVDEVIIDESVGEKSEDEKATENDEKAIEEIVESEDNLVENDENFVADEEKADDTEEKVEDINGKSEEKEELSEEKDESSVKENDNIDAETVEAEVKSIGSQEIIEAVKETSEEKETEIVEKSIEVEEKSHEDQEKSVNEDEKSVETIEKSPEAEEKSVNEDEKSVEIIENSIEVDENPIDVDEKPIEVDENSNEIEENLIKVEEKSIEKHEKSDEIDETLLNIQDQPSETDEKPSETDGIIAENEKISVENKENSMENIEKPDDDEEKCAEGEKNSIEIKENTEENVIEDEEKPIESEGKSVEGDGVIELTDNIETNDTEENANESENCGDQPQKVSETIDEGRNVEVNEQEPQKESIELPKESETEMSDNNVVLSSDEIDGEKVPVVEDICEKRTIGMLEPDQENLESEIVEFPLNKGSSAEASVEGNKNDFEDNLEKLPSGEVEYAPLKESFSEHDGSVDEVDNKSRDLTDEKSIDNDTTGSRHNSVDELEVDEAKAIESFVPSSAAAMTIEPILQTEISPMELMDEIVNECAGAVANEMIFTSHVEPSESNLVESLEGENAEPAEIVEPKLMEKNPLEEIATTKSIDLSQETIHRSEEEIEPIRDEILQPEGEESEIPEETQAPVDENIPVVSMEMEEEKTPSIENDEKLPTEENRGDENNENEKSPQEDDDDVLNMVLDEEMEDAALKIQAAFRGHKVRKEKLSSIETEQENSQDEETQKVDSNIVIDQCSDENVENQDNEENEQEDTSADCEEIQESETGDQEEAQEEETAEEEETAQEEETAVENETNEQGEDDPEEGETSEQPQNDDDDVANMVLDDEMEQAALRIQSTFRGHKTRKNMKKDETEAETCEEQEEQKEATDELDDDIKNMVLDDEMAQAALKIQSTFRGHKTRKEMKKDDAPADEGDSENKEDEEEKKEEETPKEEEPAASSSTEKSAQQIQEEEDIANLVMDEEMEKTALKIQSAFRGKKSFGRKPKDDDGESTASSALDQQSENELPNEESPVKSEEDPFQQSDESSRERMGEKSYDDEKGSDYSAAHYSSTEGNQYSVDRYNTSYEYEAEPLAYSSTDDINLMQGGGIFPEPSGESSHELMTGSSGEDRNPHRQSSYDKVPSDKSFEIDESITSRHESTDEKVIENFDFVANKDTAEAMYYSLKKNEIETQKQHSMEKQLTIESNPTEDDEEKQASSQENQSLEDEDDDDVVVGMRGPPPSAKRLKYGMSMDDRLLGSILSQDYSKGRKEGYPDDGFDPMLEAAMRNHHFLEKLHEISNSDEDRTVPYCTDFPDGVGDEDQFDDFYNSNNIRQKMMASSISIADSDYFDPTNNKSIIDDDKIRTALETIHSTDSESTIGSAATKIPLVGGVGGRRINITTHSMQYSSIGNAAIDRSLDEFIQSQELRIDRVDEEMEGYTSPPPRKQESEEWTDDTTTYTDSDKKLPSGGIIEIKLEQKSFLTVDERRRTLHREDAIQRNSTREDEASSNSSGERLSERNSSIAETVAAAITPQESVTDTAIKVPVVDLTEKSNFSSLSQTKPRMKRQHTMPVQIQTDVIRVIPKHLRKRIKSADGEKKKRYSK